MVLYLCSEQSNIIMYSNEDLECFYFKYQSEALPHGQSLQAPSVRTTMYHTLSFPNGRGYSPKYRGSSG